MPFIFLIASLIKCGEGIKVEPVAAEVRARYGSYPVLSVTIDTTKYPTLQEITWYKGDLSSPISQQNERYRVAGKGTQLNIALTRTSDYTIYYCRVRGGEELCAGCKDCSNTCANCCATITLAKTEESGATPTLTQAKNIWDASETMTIFFGISSGAYTVEQVTWYQGTYPITTGGRYTITQVNSSQNRLTVTGSVSADNGEYAVVFKTINSGVVGYGITTFDIQVLGSPSVTVLPDTAKVTEGSDVTFTCSVKASSTQLTYRWDKNSVQIVGQASPELVISNVVHENAAAYMCTVSFSNLGTTYSASTTSYLVINDDTILLIKTPFLLADVSAPAAHLSFDISSRINEGMNSDMVTWYKDNVVIEAGGHRSFGNTNKQLIITKPTAADEGHYRVLVQLTTITLEGSMYLAITSALPTVQFSAGTYVGRSGEQLTFSIAVGGNPQPNIHQIEWYSNDARLNQGDTNVRFSEDFLTLYRSALSAADTGVIKVAAETSAGRTEETAVVQIIQQEDIQATRSSDNQLIGKSLKLAVKFHMMPLPVEHNVQWSRSGEILTETDPRIEFYNSGQELLIRDVQLSDADRTYRVAVNKADGTTATKELQVSVKRTADTPQFTTRPTDTDVYAGSTVTIPCDVSGTPSPTISFLFSNNSQLLNEGRFYVTASSLQIHAAQVSDSGGYICRASIGGDTNPISAPFTLTVNDRIKITSAATEIEATMGGTAKFTVRVEPTNAKVEWTRLGVHFPESDGGHYDVSDSIKDEAGVSYKEVILTISDVQTSDLGQYEATGSYSEGKYVKSIQLKLGNAGVNVVSITAASGDQTVFRGQSAKFSCAVSDDQSIITWTKNGVDVLSLDDSIRSRYQLTSSKQELTITNTADLDEGLFMCSVLSGNERDEMSATLTVLPPIKITEYPTHKRLLLGTGSSYPLSVHITSGDTNSEIISWKLDGNTIQGDSTSLSPSIPSSAGTQKYTVTSSLTTWLGARDEQDEVDILVTTYDASDVQEAIIVQPPVDQIAILGSTVTFHCVAYGIPDPNVHWSRGSADLPSTDYTSKFTERGVESQLIISNVKIDKQGEYRCKADNLKGSIQTKSVYLEIISPPTVGLVDSVYYGVPGKELVIDVQVTYQNVIEKSMCSWTRNGIQLQEQSGSTEFGDDGTSLRIVSVEPAHAGNYRFTIETEAGSATTSTTLQIISTYVYPTAVIPQYSKVMVALKGSVYFLPCDVAGKPVPKVSWKRTIEDQTVEYKDSGSELPYSVQAAGSLRITSVKESDKGQWTCVAQSSPDSVVRTAEASLELDVVEWLARPFVYPYHGHSSITVVSGDNLEVNIEVMYRYQIRAHNIVWSRLDFGNTNWTQAEELNTIDPGYDNVVSFNRERRQLLVHGISKLFQGQYKASVATVSGKDETVIMVYVISRVPPNIKWIDSINNLYYTVNANNNRHGFVFKVDVTGEPFPKEITWYKKAGFGDFEGIRNGTVGTSYYTIGYFGDLYVKNPDKSDSTFYKIQVIPENGGRDQMEESSIELIVKDYYLGFQTAPYVGGIQKIGLSVSMDCDVTGVPDPDSVTWYKGISRLTPTTPRLTIPSVAKTDKGDYYCVARNDYGTIYSPKVALQVQYLDTNFSPITCLKEAENSMLDCSNGLTEGDVFMLKCNGPDGWPYPKTTWSFNDNVMSDNGDGLSATVNQYGDLVFPFAEPDQSGNYHCQVINEKGSLSNPYPRYHVNIANSDDTDIDQSKTPAWLVQPGDMTVAQHTPVTIACVVSSFPKPTYRWTFNSSPFTAEMEEKLSFGGRLLTFDLIEQDFDGDYSCITTTAEGENPASFKLQVATRPSFVDAKIFMIGYIGNETEIDLGTPAGHPVPTIVWTFNGEGVQLGNRIKLVDSSKMRIDPTQASDEGVWQAIATNKAGSAQHAIFLKVEEVLEFVEHPSPGGDMYAAQYSTVRFPCKVAGSPPPVQYKWYRKDHLQEPFNGLPARAFEDEEHALVIPFTQTWDNGTYICEVTNEYFHTIWGSVDLIVVEPPSIVLPPVDYKVNEFGDPSYLKCRCNPQAVATNPCVVQFLKDGVPVLVGGDVTINVVNKFSRELSIAKTEEIHLGRYECYGHNTFGSASAFAYITKTNKPYMILKPPEKLTTSSKSSVQLECNAIGYTPINYMWTFNSHPINVASDSRMIVGETGSLLIDGTTTADTGTFTCFASNPYGQSSVSSFLEVEGPPTQPPSPWVSSMSRDVSNSNLYSATIWVKTYDSIPVKKYIITRTEVATSTTSRVSTSNNPYTWSNMEPKSYTFSVVLQNEIEASTSSIPSGPVDFRDYDSVPRSSITNLQAGVDNKTISWDPIGATSYKLYHQLVSSGSRSVLGSVTTNSYTLPTDGGVLESYTEYDIQVVPVLASKEGLYSEPLRLRTPPSTPSPPTITGFLTTSEPTEIIVQFTSNWQSNVGVIKEFNIFFKRESFDYSVSSEESSDLVRRERRQSSGRVQAGSAAQNVWVSELVPGEMYSFEVALVNNEDVTSERSIAVSTVTQTGLPGRPEVTYCDGSGRDAVLVKWSAPSVTNGIVRGYKVYYRDNNSFDNQSALVLADTGIKQDGFHSKNVTGLAENTEYYFAVSGYTDAGEGEKTEWTLAKTRQKSVPNIMEAPTVVIVSWHSIHVTWKLTDDGLTGIDTFTIFLNSQIDRRGASSYVIPNRNDRSATLTTLDDDTSYSLSIVATNNIGSSPRSSTVQFRTWKKPLYLRVWFAGLLTGIFAILFILLFVVLFYYFIYKKKLLPAQQKKEKQPMPFIGRDAGPGNPKDRSLVLGNPVIAADHISEKYSTRNSRAGDNKAAPYNSGAVPSGGSTHSPAPHPPQDMRMSELRNRQESDSRSYSSNTQPRRYNDDGYSGSYDGSYKKDFYEPNNNHPEPRQPYHDNRYSDDNRDHYSNDNRDHYSNDHHSDQFDQGKGTSDYTGRGNYRGNYSDRGGYSDRGSAAGYYDRVPGSHDQQPSNERGENYQNQYDDDRYSSSDNNNPDYNRRDLSDGGLVIDNPSAARFSQI